MGKKYFEIRDRATFIPVMANKLRAVSEQERYLIAKAGYGTTIESQEEYLVLTQLDGLETHADPHSWGGRTMPTAHAYIDANYTALKSGSVIDVEYILNETEEKKTTQNKGGLVW